MVSSDAGIYKYLLPNRIKKHRLISQTVLSCTDFQVTAQKPPFPRKGDAIAVSGKAANGYPVKGGAPVRKLGRRIVFREAKRAKQTKIA